MMNKYFFGALILTIIRVSGAPGSIFTVTTCQDGIDGSLFWAIQQAERHSGPDTITFALTPEDPGWDRNKGAWRIEVITPLPEFLDGGTFIDGSSQTRYGGDTNKQGPEIFIFGQNAPFEKPGFILRSAENKFFHLSIGAFPSYIFRLYGANAHHNVFHGLYLNLDATGRYPYRVVKSEGIRMSQGAHHNIIGGTTVAERNVMSGFYGRALYLEQSHYNVIKGNYIGVKKNGLDPAGNGWTDEWATYPTRHRPDAFEGVLLTDGCRGNQIGGLEPGAGNVIAANLRTGLRLESTGTDSNIVQNNYVGVAADGETPLGNGEAGIWIAGDPAGTGLSPGPAYNILEGNVISANLSSGVQMRWGSHHNRLLRNYIGTNAKGNRSLPNSHNGIYFFGRPDKGYPQYNLVGPDNVIMADSLDTVRDPWAAVRMDDPLTAYNQVLGNYLCCNREGTLRSSYNSGVYLSKGASRNIIGPGNVITGKNYGVWLRHDSTRYNTITRNRIFATASAPIFLDSGANEDLAPPLLLAASSSFVSGTTLPLGLIEFYSGSDGQLDAFVAETAADQNGHFHWQGEMGTTLVTATVRDSSGNTSMAAYSVATPVELVSFTAERRSDRLLRLHWQTASETDNLGFYLQKRYESSEFVNIAFLPGHGTTQETHAYVYDDPSGDAQTEAVFYRLLQVDRDGPSHSSREICIELALPKELELSRAFPNPFNDRTRISLKVPKAITCILRVYDLQGRQVATLCDGLLHAGHHSFQWDAKNENGQPLSSGVYWLALDGDGVHKNQKILLLR